MSLKLNVNSWHFQMVASVKPTGFSDWEYTYLNKSHPFKGIPTIDLCTYMRWVIISIIVMMTLVGLVLLLVAVVGTAIFHYGWYLYAHDPDKLGLALAGAGTSSLLVWITFKILDDKYDLIGWELELHRQFWKKYLRIFPNSKIGQKESLPGNPNNHSLRNLIKKWIRSKKEKVCPLLEVELEPINKD